MGKTKIKVFDESTEEVKEKKGKILKMVKSNVAKASGAVEHNTEFGATSEEAGAKQTPSERSGDASGALHIDEPSPEQSDIKSPAKPNEPKSNKSQKPGKSKPRSKKYQEVFKDLDKTQSYDLNEAIDLVKKNSYSKFVGTLETHINTNQLNMRGLVSLPFVSGKKLKIVAFGKNAEGSGADIIGTDEFIEEINKGKVSFDILVTTPEWMTKLAKVARILGPRSLMPNPKNGTITDDLKKAVEGFQSGKTEYRTETKAPVIHLGLGKLDQPTEELSANLKTLLQTLGKSRVKKVSLSPTMGPSIRINLTSI